MGRARSPDRVGVRLGGLEMIVKRRRSTRRGFTLVEMIVVIGGITIILGLCAGLLHTLLRLDRSGRESLNDTNTLARLARQFRQDVRASRAAKPGDAGSLALTRPDGPDVSYRVQGARLVREERAGEKVVRREAYAVARIGPLRFETEGAFVRLIAARRPTNPLAPPRTAVGVEARLDKDRTQRDPAEAPK